MANLTHSEISVLVVYLTSGYWAQLATSWRWEEEMRFLSWLYILRQANVTQLVTRQEPREEEIDLS